MRDVNKSSSGIFMSVSAILSARFLNSCSSCREADPELTFALQVAPRWIHVLEIH